MSSQDGRVTPNNEGPVRHVESLVGLCPITAFLGKWLRRPAQPQVTEVGGED